MFAVFLASFSSTNWKRSFLTIHSLMHRVESSSCSYNLIFDSHCHIQYQYEKSSSFLESERTLSYRFAVMGTRPLDWDDVVNMRNIFRTKVYCGLGLHPWFAHNQNDLSWLERMKTELSENSDMIVGEIGLDKLWKPPDTQKNEFQSQLPVFESQFELAVQYQRPVSIHCVKADGAMIDFLRQQSHFPPAIYFHSYGGSIDTLKLLTRMKDIGNRIYFGFSAAVNMRSPKTPGVIASVPDDRILLESDLEGPENVLEDLDRMVQLIATCKGWTVEETIQRTTSNAYSFYHF